MDISATTAIKMEAAGQAAQGNFEAALALLGRLSNAAPDASVSVLRAKILSQRGDFAAAVAEWESASAADPTNETAQRGLALAKSMARSSFGRLRLRARAYATAALTVGAVIALFLVIARTTSLHEVLQTLTSVEQQHGDEIRAVSSRIDAETNGLRAAIDSSRALAQTIAEEQTRVTRQEREQLRRLEAQMTALTEAIRRLEKP